MRVAYLVRTTSLGGAEIQAVRAARALGRAGAAVEIWAPAGSWVAELARRAGLAVRERASGLIPPSRLDGVDVLHVHTAADVPWAAFAAQAARVPLVVTRHLAAHGRRRRDPYHAWLAARARFVAASGFVRRSLGESYGLAPERIALVPYGYAAAESEPEPPRTAEPRPAAWLGVPAGARVIGMLSRLSWGKHLSDALGVLARVRERGIEASLVVAGEETDRGARRALLEEAERRSLESHVRLLGHRADRSALLRSFDLLLHTAHAESFGLSILEAMAHGCPVVAAAGGGVPELVRAGVTAQVAAPGDVAALAAGAEALLADRELAQSMASEAAADVARRFPPAAEAAALASLYRESLG